MIDKTADLLRDHVQQRGAIDRGPEPASPLPWEFSGQIYSTVDPWPMVIGTETTGRPWMTIDVLVMKNEDAEAIVHRVNGWDALLSQRDAMAAKLSRVEALVKDRWQGTAEDLAIVIRAAVKGEP